MIRHESMVIALAVLATLSGDVQGGNIQFRFEKLFPTLQQPWYFAPTGDITLDGDGFIYVAERENERVRKFTRDGQLVTNLGREGDSPGAFLNPVDLTVATNDLLYVTDQDRHRILVFTTDGAFVREFGEFGAGNGQFDRPRGIASRGEFLYVVDSFNQRIQKLNLDGDFVAQWGELGSGNGQFEFDAVPFRFRHADIAISPTGQVYVSDTRNHRIQYFDSEGVYLGQWGSEGEGIGQFNEPGALEVDEFGIVFVADRANRVQRFSADGLFLSRIDYPAEETAGNFLTGLAKASGRIYVRDLFRISQFLPTGEFADAFASSGKRLGQYNFPGGLAADPAGQIYMADQFNNRVQIHDADGKAIGVLGEAGPDPGQFSLPTAVAFDSQGRLFVSERGNDRVQVFDQSLNPAAIWGSAGSGPGQFADPVGLAFDSQDNLYVVDLELNRVLKFSSSGQFITEWGTLGTGEGQFAFPSGIAIDDQNTIFIGDRENHRVQAFDSDGVFQFEFGEFGQGNGQFRIAESLALDSGGILFVSDIDNNRLQAFTRGGEYVGKYDFPGYAPGSLIRPGRVLFAPQQRVFVVGARNNRLQRFSRILTQPDSKVVVVAGGGPYPGNALWDATQVNANYAYRTLLIRGFDKQLINYLSPDTALDLDQNGLADDVDAVPTSESLREAITGSFTADAQNLLLYLVDHGGEDTFRLTEGETVGAQDLGSWLDQYQAAHPGSKVTVIYDACQSGSMMDELRSSIYDRVVITSATGSQNAYFVSQGTLSFSSFFWSQVFNGASVGEAFVAAAQNTTASFPNQTPQIDADGDGVNNTTADTDAVAGLFVGVGEIDDGDLPVIGGVSAPQAATGSTATISANGVTDDDGIGRVWAVMRPPAFSTGSPDNPVQDLPGFDLQRVPGTDTFQTEFEGFTDPGTYQIAIHARDRLGNAAVPLLTSVLVDNPLRRRAIVVSGGVPDDARYSSLARNADAAISALTQQGYGADGVSCSDSSCDDVYVLTNAGSAGVDAASTLANLEFALTTWGVDQVQDLTLYLVAENAAGQLRLNETESLDSTTLKGWLDTAEANIAGVVTVVLEADSGGEFVRALAPDSGQSRYLVSSTDTGETAAFLLQGRVSFSAFFWSQVFNGDNLRGAFRQAQTAIRFRTGAQSAQLDDNGNGISNEVLDGVNARQYAIGAGVQLAGDAPFVGTAVVSDQLTSSFETIAAEQVTSTSAVEEVIAVVTRPDATIVTQPLPSAGGIYQDRSYGLCGPAGDYDVAVYAIDEDGNVSLPATPDDGPINRPADCSDFQFASGFE